jgi:uncharacterized protein (DUF1330 family)
LALSSKADRNRNLEIADTAAVKRWYNSPEYQKILPGRLDNSTSRAFIVEGAS